MKTPARSRGAETEIEEAWGGDRDPTAPRAPAHISGLAEIAERINAEHAAAELHARTAVDHAIAAGELLAQAKAMVTHGEWLPWLAAHVTVTDRTARRYIQLAREVPRLDLEDRTRVSDMPLRQALAYLADRDGDDVKDGLDLDMAAPDPDPSPDPEQAPSTAPIPEPDPEPGAWQFRAQPMLSAESVEWYTPAPIIEAARRVLGEIDLDPASCAEANATVRARRFYTVDDDGLALPWRGRVWCNPPFSAAGRFAAKAVEAHQAGDIEAAILLLSAGAASTQWFTPLWGHVLAFSRGRWKFSRPGGEPGGANTVGSILVYLGPRPDRFAAEFAPVAVPVVRWPGVAAAGEVAGR